MENEPNRPLDTAQPGTRPLLVDKQGRQWEFMHELGDKGLVASEVGQPGHQKLVDDVEGMAQLRGVAVPAQLTGGHYFDKDVSGSGVEHVVVRDRQGEEVKRVPMDMVGDAWGVTGQEQRPVKGVWHKEGQHIPVTVVGAVDGPGPAQLKVKGQDAPVPRSELTWGGYAEAASGHIGNLEQQLQDLTRQFEEFRAEAAAKDQALQAENQELRREFQETLSKNQTMQEEILAAREQIANHNSEPAEQPLSTTDEELTNPVDRPGFTPNTLRDLSFLDDSVSPGPSPETAQEPKPSILSRLRNRRQRHRSPEVPAGEGQDGTAEMIPLNDLPAFFAERGGPPIVPAEGPENGREEIRRLFEQLDKSLWANSTDSHLEKLGKRAAKVVIWTGGLVVGSTVGFFPTVAGLGGYGIYRKGRRFFNKKKNEDFPSPEEGGVQPVGTPTPGRLDWEVVETPESAVE